jgi:hypothetical protein
MQVKKNEKFELQNWPIITHNSAPQFLVIQVTVIQEIFIKMNVDTNIQKKV